MHSTPWLFCSLLFGCVALSPLTALAQDAWTLEGGHVLVARKSAVDEVGAKTANKTIEAWIDERVAMAKTPQVIVIGPEAAAKLVEALRKGGKTVAERKEGLRGLSKQHAEVRNTLEDFQELLSQSASDFKARQKAEQEMSDRLRNQAGMARPVRDTLLVSTSRHERIFLAGVLGRFPIGQEHEEVLLVPDNAIVIKLSRALPDTAKGQAVLRKAFTRQSDETCQRVLLREIGAGASSKEDFALLREIAPSADWSMALRLEAVTFLGRKKDKASFSVLAQLAKKADLQLRQRAIVSAAEADPTKGIPLLKELSKDGDLRVRATTVLALGRVGNDEALVLLDEIAQNDASAAIKKRAARMAANLRLKRKRK